MKDIEYYRYEEDRGLYRLSARFDNYKAKKFCDMNQEELEASLKLFIDDVKRLPITPELVTITENQCFLDWHFMEEVIIKTKSELEVLVANFVSFIEQIPFSKGSVNCGFFLDDPYEENMRNNTYRNVFGVRNTIVPVTVKMYDIQPLTEYVRVEDCR